MKILGTLLIGAAIAALPLYAQQPPQPAVKRHPGEHLHYNVKLPDGSIDKVTNVSINLNTSTPAGPTQPGAGGELGAQCQKTPDPKLWTCDVLITTGIRDGDYRVYHVGVSSDVFGKDYNDDFHLPIVPIENPRTFTPPSKVDVTVQP